MIGAPWGSNKTRFLLIFFIYVLTVCWNSFNFDDTLMVTIYQIGQSAGNQIEIESLRDYTLVIASTNLISIEKIEKNNKLGSYLAGLIEGDGHIVLPFLSESSKKGSSPRFEITFHDSNLPLAQKLVETLNCGKVRFLKTQNAYRLEFRGPQELIKIVTLVNGHFRTPKIESLNQLINWLNSSPRGHDAASLNCNFEKYTNDTSSLLNNPWFAGFSDADSNFYIRTSEKTMNPVTGKFSKARIACRFALEQRKIEPKFLQPTEPFMKQIADTFHVSLLTSKHNNPPSEYWCIHVSSRKGVKELINYFSTFPLMGSKYLDFLDFRSVYELIDQNIHLTESGRLEIYNLKNKMNKARVEYSWAHQSKPLPQPYDRYTA